jgi:EF hand
MNRYLPLLAAALVSFGAFAGETATTMSFESLDKNADQKLTASEAMPDKALSDSFAKADTNKDGYISRAEFDAYTKKKS